MRQRSGKVDPAFSFCDVDAATGSCRPVIEPERLLNLLREVSPMEHVSNDDPPTMLIHGDRDRAVPIQQSRQLMERLKDNGVVVKLVVREGKGHAWPGWESDSALIAEWFDRCLRR
jgi:dipeptidyl aminopeptidase/acylaminoacyl peptidase